MALVTTDSYSNWSTNTSACLLFLSACCCLSRNCVVLICLQAVLELSVLSLTVLSLSFFLSSLFGLQFPLRYERSALTDVCERIQHGFLCPNSPSHAIMSFSAQDFPWNNKVAWQICGMKKRWLNVSVFLAACASLLLSADRHEVMWSVPAWKLKGAGLNLPE